MFGKNPRMTRLTGILAGGIAAGMLTAVPAHAVVGTAANDGEYGFTARIDIGGERACSGALVDRQWVLTASRCFADNPEQDFKVTAGVPKKKTTAVIGRTDMTSDKGQTADIVELVPRGERDLVMAKLAKPVAGIAPVTVAGTAPASGGQVQAAGYGRTKDEWAPDRLHSAGFTVNATDATSLKISGVSGAALCPGDTGAPIVRAGAKGLELVGIGSTSRQAGCFGVDAGETRTEATATRADDLTAWVEAVRYRTTFSNAPWNKATHIATGYFTGGSAGGTRHMDMIVRWNDAEVTLYEGADDKDAKHPFVAEYQLAAPTNPTKKSTWEYASQITGASFGNGTDGLVVRWVDGEVTQYTHVDKKGFHGEKMLVKSAEWTKATQITAGRYTDNAQRDDLVVVWNDGHVTLHPDLDTNGVKPAAQKQLVKANTTWPHATQVTSGEFTGKKTADLLVRWSDGEATIYPGVDTAGLHGETQIRQRQSDWLNATVVGAGAFVANERPNDVMVRWADGTLSMYPGVDAKGLHDQVKIVG
ncbi:S1 family peptidase [Streptomyces rimosus]|uniref:S1 family peptidase n=1 Tax=Streptomyces rimosus TaxID=1927 RepID=UPI00379B1B27